MAKMASAIGLAWKDASLFSSPADERKLMNHFVVNLSTTAESGRGDC
jgi:hypothetical protein